MAAIVLAQAASTFLAPTLYGALAAGASVGASAGLFALSQGLAGVAGAVVGGAIDRKLFGAGGESAQGPRLSDLTYQGHSEGAALPIVYGSARMAGTVIWTTGLEETKHKEDVGGGSGGGGGTVTTYTYKTDVAVALCEGEVTGIRRIWADSKLIYEASDTATAATLLASSENVEAIRFYAGSETQEADPLIQATEGVTDTPAFLDTAYVVFEDFQLADYGNRIPNFTFELIKTDAAYGLPYDSFDDFLYTVSGLGAFSYITTYYTTDEGVYYAVVYALAAESYRIKITTYFYPFGATAAVLYKHIDTGITMSAAIGFTRMTCEGQYLSFNTNGNLHYVDIDTGSVGPVWAPYPNTDYPVFVYIESNDLIWYGFSSHGVFRNSTKGDSITGCSMGDRMYRDAGNLFYVSPASNKVYRLNDQSGAIEETWTITGYSTATMFVHDGRLWYSNNPGGPLHEWVLTDGYTVTYGTNIHYNDCPGGAHQLIRRSGLHIMISGALRAEVKYYRTNDLAQTTTALDDVVSDILAAADLDPADYDVTDLASDTVRGYVISHPMSARAALEPLMSAYQFDLVEEDGKIKAIKRGNTAVLALTDDDLGAAEGIQPDKAIAARANEIELPSEVQVGYADIEADYQPGSQYARMLTAAHVNQLSVNLPMAMTSQEAARLADVLLRQAWYAGRYDYQLSLTYEQARLSPTDVITAPVLGATETLRITGVDLGAPGIVALKAVPELVSLYTSARIGGDATGVGQTIAAIGPTHLLLLDSVSLRDSEDEPGWYLAACGYIAGWPGGVLYKSSDGGATYTQAATVLPTQAGTIGYATTVLGSADCRGWDSASALTVQLYTGTLSSATEADVLNGANACLIGAAGRWELIQFRTATLNGDGTYTLTDLLRGRRGTEYAAASHAIYDAFVLLSTTTLQDIALSSSEIGAERHYKAPTSGKALESVSAQAMTYAGERLKCLAPVLLGGGRDASGNITINWTRRDRLNAGWLNYSDVPMSEATQSYEVDIYTTSAYTTVKRTITGLATATASYTSAQQVTDFGGNQSTIYVRVYQLSATVGRGHYLQGSL